MEVPTCDSIGLCHMSLDCTGLAFGECDISFWCFCPPLRTASGLALARLLVHHRRLAGHRPQAGRSAVEVWLYRSPAMTVAPERHRQRGLRRAVL